MKKEKKQKLPIALKIIIIVLSVLIALMLILTVVFFSLRSSGKKSLYSKVEDAQPDFGSFGEIETEETTTESTVGEKETTKSAADNNDNKEKKIENSLMKGLLDNVSDENLTILAEEISKFK